MHTAAPVQIPTRPDPNTWGACVQHGHGMQQVQLVPGNSVHNNASRHVCISPGARGHKAQKRLLCSVGKRSWHPHAAAWLGQCGADGTHAACSGAVMAAQANEAPALAVTRLSVHIWAVSAWTAADCHSSQPLLGALDCPEGVCRTALSAGWVALPANRLGRVCSLTLLARRFSSETHWVQSGQTNWVQSGRALGAPTARQSASLRPCLSKHARTS